MNRVLARAACTLLATMLPCASAGAQAISSVRDYQRGVNAEHYVFHVTIPDSGRRVEVVSTLYLRRTQQVDSLTLDLDSTMHVRRVLVNAAQATYARTASHVRVALPRWDPKCADAKPDMIDRPDPCLAWVTVDVIGTPRDGLNITRDAQGRWQYFADHWPNRARGWLPSIDHPSDKATVEWRVHAPSSLRVVANGKLTEESPLPNAAGRSITVWQTGKPIPVYLMVIAVAPMAKISLGATACGLAEDGGCVQQDVYEAPELAPQTPRGFAAAGSIVEWLSRTVAPFPYEKLSHLQSSTQYGGMENASAIFYASNLFPNMSLSEGLVAHETAHQWFGDAVTPARWGDLWLSESFATYFAALWEREARGDSGFRASMANIRRTVLNAPVVRERPVVDTTQTELMSLLNANSYQKGGYVLHMLRNQVGDSAWFKAIRAYYAAFKHKNATTEDLRAAMERESRSDLKWFFDQWVRRPGYAELDVSWTHDGAFIAQIVQSGKYGFYRLRLPVEVEDASGVVTRTVLDVPATGTSRITLPGRFAAKPRRVTFDPASDVLAVITGR